MWWETGGCGPRSGRDRALAALAGVFFSADLICWHHAIEDVGAGLATVLGNLQVAFVPLVAWLALGERPAGAILATLPARAQRRRARLGGARGRRVRRRTRRRA